MIDALQLHLSTSQSLVATFASGFKLRLVLLEPMTAQT
jgi:hypothetical protein